MRSRETRTVQVKGRNRVARTVSAETHSGTDIAGLTTRKGPRNANSIYDAVKTCSWRFLDKKYCDVGKAEAEGEDAGRRRRRMCPRRYA